MGSLKVAGGRRLPLATSILLLAALVPGLLFTWIGSSATVHAPDWLLPIDDGYVFLRYAQQAARGLPLQWNEGEPSTGASSFLYPWLEAPVFWITEGLRPASRWAFWLGVVGLWALGVGGVRLLREAGAPEPWPLAGGLSLAWSGPLVFGALGGMESAANAAAIVWALAWWAASDRPDCPRRTRLGALLLVGALPLFRPENGALTLLAAIAVASGWKPGVRKRVAIGLLVPGLLLAALDLWLTGHLAPAGALAKSRLGGAFLDLPLLASLWFHGLVRWILPLYVGAVPLVLPAPVGWLAAGGTVTALVSRLRETPSKSVVRWRALASAGIVWLVLVLLAPMSSIPHWHFWRHHHAGIALALLLGMAGAAEITERLRRWANRPPVWGFVSLALPLSLALLLPSWGLRYARGMDVLWIRNGRAAEWIEGLEGDPVLLVDDAGLLALAHDGPLVDAVGLGSNGLALAFRNGPGSLLESLARHAPTPEIAAVHEGLFRIPALLGAPLRFPSTRGDALVAPVRADRLRSTISPSDLALDFAYLPDERELSWRWEPTPHPNRASFALLRTSPDGSEVLGGCRPLENRLRFPLPFPLPVAVRASAASERATGLVARVVGSDGRIVLSREVAIDGERWTDLTLGDTPGEGDGLALELERSGPGLPCLESLVADPGDPRRP